MRICGIDPGLRATGWGVIDTLGNRIKWVGDGVIRPDSTAPMPARLHHIHEQVSMVITTHQPDCVAIEDVFIAKGVASGIKLGMARGAAMVAGGNLPVYELAARRVKQNITGSGRADKAQVAAMVARLLQITPSGADAADALAIAIAASHEKPPGASPKTAPQTASKTAPNNGLASAIAAAMAKQGDQP